ncbi:MAG: F-type H+-transporting ATPase beta subunit AtpF [Roseibaca calidilacus]|uniref:ATP synthase subunit b n=2 Tax=Roseibaca calidilacus TaxID=1666912 RepID=A0A0P7WNA1_9RHOB|nr:MAG: F-type H+-transporting ATPase beta subunit AtpF [Roseibaca calidilacus]CUX79615.1 ATP synthase F0 subcomplex B subunit [Roseibaca calidilacus]
MMLRLAAIAMLLASPALAAVEGKPFFSLYNTDLIVLAAFTVFIGILIYAKVPGKLGDLLDQRSATIKAELEEARRLREEALELHASFERKQAEVKAEAARIVEKAKADAQLAAEQTKAEIEASITRRLKAAEDQIASAEAGAIRQVRDKATEVAIAAAGTVIAKNMDDARSDALIADAIKAVNERLH